MTSSDDKTKEDTLVGAMTSSDDKTKKDTLVGAMGGLSVAGKEQGSSDGRKGLSLHVFGDILQFCIDSAVQSYRLLCRAVNALITHYPKSFQQRRHFRRLEILPAWRYHREDTENWLDLPDLKDCCKDDLEPIANTMAGTLFDATVRAEHLFVMKLEPYGRTTKPIKLSILNQFTSMAAAAPTSAFHYLHFLKHLDGCTIEEVQLGAYHHFPVGLFSTIHCRSLFIQSPLLPALSVLQNYTSVFKPQVVRVKARDEQLKQDLQRIRGYGQLPFRFELNYMSVDEGEFNSAFNILRRTRDVRSIVSEVELDLIIKGDWNKWPMDSFNRWEAISVGESEEYGISFRHYVFAFGYNQLHRIEVKVGRGKVWSVIFKFSGGD